MLTLTGWECAGRLFPLVGMLLRRERVRVLGRLPLPQPPTPRAPPPREVVPGVPFPTCITAEQAGLEEQPLHRCTARVSLSAASKVIAFCQLATAACL